MRFNPIFNIQEDKKKKRTKGREGLFENTIIRIHPFKRNVIGQSVANRGRTETTFTIHDQTSDLIYTTRVFVACSISTRKVALYTTKLMVQIE